MTNNEYLIYRLAELMLKSGDRELSVDGLFEDEFIGDFVRNIQIDSPYQQLLFEGVLTERMQKGVMKVGFTLEGYFHHVLGEVIHHRYQGKGAAELLALIESSTLNGMQEGVERCLIKDTKTGQLSRLMDLIDIQVAESQITNWPLAFAFIYNDPRKVYNAVMANPTKKDLYALRSVCGILEDNHKLRVLKELRGIINDSNDLSTFISTLTSKSNEDNTKELFELLSFQKEFGSYSQTKSDLENIIQKEEENEKDILMTILKELKELKESKGQ